MLCEYSQALTFELEYFEYLKFGKFSSSSISSLNGIVRAFELFEPRPNTSTYTWVQKCSHSHCSIITTIGV